MIEKIVTGEFVHALYEGEGDTVRIDMLDETATPSSAPSRTK